MIVDEETEQKRSLFLMAMRNFYFNSSIIAGNSRVSNNFVQFLSLFTLRKVPQTRNMRVSKDVSRYQDQSDCATCTLTLKGDFDCFVRRKPVVRRLDNAISTG